MENRREIPQNIKTIIKSSNSTPRYLSEENTNSRTSQVALVVKNPPANAGDVRDVGLIPGLARSPGGGHGNPLQYTCLENPHGQRSLEGYSPWGHKRVRHNRSDIARMHM